MLLDPPEFDPNYRTPGHSRHRGPQGLTMCPTRLPCLNPDLQAPRTDGNAISNILELDRDPVAV